MSKWTDTRDGDVIPSVHLLVCSFVCGICGMNKQKNEWTNEQMNRHMWWWCHSVCSFASLFIRLFVCSLVYLFIFSTHFLRRLSTDSFDTFPHDVHYRQQKRCCADFLKVSLYKINEGQKPNLQHFRTMLQTNYAVVPNANGYYKSQTNLSSADNWTRPILWPNLVVVWQKVTEIGLLTLCAIDWADLANIVTSVDSVIVRTPSSKNVGFAYISRMPPGPGCEFTRLKTRY